jgi:hypothetical protein
MKPAYTYEPAKGYSVPVVRVLNEGRVYWTLSFSKEGKPINPPFGVGDRELDAAWEAWERSAA